MPNKTLEKLAGANILTHPINATIIKYLQNQGEANTSQISENLGINEDLITFQLLNLSEKGFVTHNYQADPKVPSAKLYFKTTQKVEEIINYLTEYFEIGKH